MDTPAHPLPDELTDIYLPKNDVAGGFYYPGGLPIPPELYGYMGELLAMAMVQPHDDFSLLFRDEFFRGHRMTTVAGDMYVLRRIPKALWTLAQCAIPGPISREMLSERLNTGGLVLIVGRPGNGKSTTCAALIAERLTRYGGLCLTVEDPIEMPLHGRHGPGVCLQSSVNTRMEYAEAVRGTMRGYPTGENSMMMVGEVRDPETAALVLRSAVDGRLVVTTIHAGSLTNGLQRILALASASINQSEAIDLLAAGIRLVLHQRLFRASPSAPMRLKMEVLMDTQSVAGHIMNSGGNLARLSSEIQYQHKLLKQNKIIELRGVDYFC